MSVVGSERVIANEDILVRLLQIGVVIEEYAEEKSAFILGLSVEDEDTKEMLMESLEESETHRDRLIELIERLDSGDTDRERIEQVVSSAIEDKITPPYSREDALKQQLKSESLARDFYDSLIDGIVNSGDNLDIENLDEILDTLRDIREDEAEDAEKLEKELEMK